MVKICAKGEPELVRARTFERIERQRQRERAERCEKLLMETMESLHGAMLQESGEVKAKLAEAECCVAAALGVRNGPFRTEM